METQSIKTNYTALATLVTVFFFWGFVAASNDILIPVFRDELKLEQWQSQLISFAFYVAYSVGSLIYYAISKISGKDLLNRIGYKNGIALGLVVSALGTLLFIPAASEASFGLMISGLFIVGLGFSLQQTAANPLAIIIGDPKTGSQRLSLAGGINNVGSTIGPVLLSLAIFGSVNSGAAQTSMESIKIPYLLLGLAFLVVAVLFKFSGIPNQLSDATDNVSDAEVGRSSALKYPQLWLGMIAIFLYVGVEVSTAANLPEYMKQHLGMGNEEVAPYVTLFWASLMIGRWASAAGAFGASEALKKVLSVVMPFAAFGLFLFILWIGNHNIEPFYNYALVIPVLIIGDFVSKGSPSRQLFIFSLLGITALMIGMHSNGMVSVYAFMSVGLFCSTLWPCIFTLAIAGLGKNTTQGSSFLIMMIMGGGFVSVFQGVLADDNLLGIRFSYFVGVACFAYLAFYAWRAKQLLIKQEIEL